MGCGSSSTSMMQDLQPQMQGSAASITEASAPAPSLLASLASPVRMANGGFSHRQAQKISLRAKPNEAEPAAGRSAWVEVAPPTQVAPAAMQADMVDSRGLSRRWLRKSRKWRPGRV
mmetsp:Transcript_70229/g.124070  ORF Transcript_70229/g.124070 Transcript_70229/m.124070 type:complete len:117 (-) Transcript_70229:154-504(-)|eukprot:CAMPEP_0197661358 /NCGR_PEP_ID=MMETSP1338-20131121/51409_1 /TAXON_ID=43686 ORGANISM="Pelagodinium beii, Strain RCC1491" /NCGR_SAMPLE_ID=MMETSP1338 /ASSEMBLY_ACC=CAM_ASM_000754 /LENGTH=116 /DNA_ID=CAMNT_0043238899 /DNA_START=44 /DNA_END=394 /DNA_ORIENTATION=-